MPLVEREQDLAAVCACAERAVAGEGTVIVVSGESGAGKTSFIEELLNRQADTMRVLAALCDPLATPRPLGPVHDLADALGENTRRVLEHAEHSYEIFEAVFADLSTTPTVLVIDDLHWADQGTIDLLRFLLRRVHRRHLLVVGTAREEEAGTGHPLRTLLADVARSDNGERVALDPLTLDGVRELTGERPVDADWLHQITGGNPFFVTQMLHHPTGDLPVTVRDAVLDRTVGLDEASWDLLNLLSCSPEAIPDYLLPHLGIALAPLRRLHHAQLIRRSPRGVAFRHDLCRLAVASVLPPGAEPHLHLRMLAAYEAAGRTDPAVMTHHALGARDQQRIRAAARQAGAMAARSGAHRQAAEFYRTAMEFGGELSPDTEAEILELLAAEYYLIDQLDNAIDACRRALRVRELAGATTELSADYHALAVYQWYNADRSAANYHAAQAVTVLESKAATTGPALVALGHAVAMQAYLAMQSNDLDHAAALLARAREIAGPAGDAALRVRVEIIEGICAVIANDDTGRAGLLDIVQSAPRHFDEIYSSGYSNLSYLDVEQRRLTDAAALLDVSLPLTVERDLPICRVWQLGTLGRLGLLSGDWDAALTSAAAVLDEPSAPLARTWPHLIRGLVALRRTGDGAAHLHRAWTLATSYGEPVRVLPAAAALAEHAWLTGVTDDRLAHHRELLDASCAPGLGWARGELAMWLRRLDPGLEASDVAGPYRRYLDGELEASAAEFERLGTPYEAALALTETGHDECVRRGLHMLDRMGAVAVADKVRLDLRSAGMKGIPARRRDTTLRNPVGLTNRQIEVLALMKDGLTNAELAEKLYLSAKTVDHHVSAILAKMGVGNRREAVRRGRDLGIIA